ncbi:MAG TPA: hypothetical protein VNO70_21725 [Blastocatellia bacterium]|nr:hypothetical protein [Blastocatellia bacterium]
MKNFLIVIAFLLAVHDISLACSCVPPGKPSEEMKESAAVFSGKVVEIRRNQRTDDFFARVEAVIEVERVWKGVEKTTVSVFTSSDSAACGYGFKEGETYLVYASGDKEGRLLTTICTRTRRMKDAGEDLKELGPGKEIAER